MLLFRLILASFLLVAATAPVAQAQQGGRIPVRVVGDRLLISCDISSPKLRIPVNLFFELETLCGLQLHNKAAASLGTETPDGRPIPLTLHFPDFQISVPKREHGDEDLLDDFTKYYSADMGEDAVVGTIGAQVLKDYHLTFDLARGYIAMEPKRDLVQEAPEPKAGTTLLTLTEENELLWAPLRTVDGNRYAIALGGSRYDTIVDQDLAYAMDAPAGDVGTVDMGGIEVDQYVALRPEELVLTHPDRAFGVLGINFFRHFRVEIDRVNRWARLTPTQPAKFPVDDFMFFEARAEEDPDMLEDFLKQWPKARLGKEGSRLLLFWRIDDAGTDQEIRNALVFNDQFEQEDLRATGALDLMKILGEDGWREYQVWAGEIGLESGRVDRYPDAVHQIHSKLGAIHLKDGRDEKAWRHLLSAAFGVPDDGMINLNLGRYYEQQGRWRRAFSRFVQAAIVPESGPQAVEGLIRVQAQMSPDVPFSVELVERMIEGKVLNFGAASSYDAEDNHVPGKVALVEFFTNSHVKGAEAGALAQEGLLSHFKDGPAVFLTYHLDQPGLDPMVHEYGLDIFRQRQVSDPYIFLVDGYLASLGGGRTRDREKLYTAARDRVYQALQAAPPWKLDIQNLRVEDGKVKGRVDVSQFLGEGQTSEDVDLDEEYPDHRLCVVLAERGVLYPGQSKVVIHRMVVRAPLTEQAFGTDMHFDNDQMQFAFEQDLRQVQQSNEAWLQDAIDSGRGQTQVMSTSLDPEQLTVVAYVVNRQTGRIEQAAQKHLGSEEEDEE